MFDIDLIRSTKGFLDEEEGAFLFETARKVSMRCACLEVGSYCGKSALYLGAGCRENGSVLYSIDHHRGSEEQQKGEEYFDPELYDDREQKVNTLTSFRKSIDEGGLDTTVVPMVASSTVVGRCWSTPLSLVFIDGGHSFEAACADYVTWSGHVVPGGYLLIHDLFEKPEDGGQAPYDVYQLALGSGLFEELPRVKTLGVLRKKML